MRPVDTTTFRLRMAVADDADALSALARRSKAHWGYSPEFLAACRDELTYTPERLRDAHTLFVVAEAARTIVGFHALLRGDDGDIELEALFVEPSHVRQGIGRRLIQDAMQRAHTMGFQRIVIQGDPNAAGFYRAIGARQIGTRASDSIPGRMLPLFVLSLSRSGVHEGLGKYSK